ncbi:alkene reductase [Tsuneonella aeria]|uniref:alkene reductase n=1 Tax=Tsuneonella aeria TaxID=1837929 RepID=UPI00301B870F
MTDALFAPVRIGALDLPNRIVMAPMTRDRAGEGDVPTADMVQYYRQRASAGLIVTEGTQPTPEGKGYWRTPGIHSQEQIDGWGRVADAVHAEGGRIAMQLMHCGRVVIPANRGFTADVIAPSAIACPDKVPGPDGVPMDCAVARAMTSADIRRVVGEYAQAARNARSAGIDAVELHCASGYLVNQFLNPASNVRDDQYGGTADNRARFAAEVLAAMADAIGGDRVGFRISPGNPYNGMDPRDPASTFVPLLRAVNGLGLAYAHVIDMGLTDLDTLQMVRDNWSGPIVANNMLKADSAAALIEAGRAEAVSFGRAFIANPDLPRRIREGAVIAKPDYALLYTGEQRGYIDYPKLNA